MPLPDRLNQKKKFPENSSGTELRIYSGNDFLSGKDKVKTSIVALYSI